MTSGAFAHRLRAATASSPLLHPIRRILRNHVARLGANSPSNKPLLKKKKRKTLITFVSLIFTTFDRIVIPLSLIPFCPPLPLQFVRSGSLDLPASSFFQPTDPLLSPPFASSVDTAVRSVDEEGLRKFLNTESCWRCWHPHPLSTTRRSLIFCPVVSRGFEFPWSENGSVTCPGFFVAF